MHPHLHREDNMACEELMTALNECHARGFIWKAMGNCNQAKEKLMVCIRAEREKRAAANRQAAKERKELGEKRRKLLEEDSP